MSDSIENILGGINENYLSEEQQKSVLDSLNALFSNGEKRNYSDSYILVNGLMSNPQKQEYVSANLTALYDANERNSLQYKDDIRKTLDYCKLEAMRYMSIHNLIDGSDSKMASIMDRMDNVDKRSTHYEQDSKEIKKAMDESTSRSVTILSIFAGVVISFVGGLSLLGSAFTSIQSNASIYRILFMLTLVGFVIYNIIISLMFVVSRFNGRDIGVRCKYRYDCHACHHARPGKISRVFCQAVNKYPYIFCVDAFLVYVMYVVFVLWLYSGNNTDVFNELFESLPFLHLWPVEIIAICAPIPAFIFTTKRPRRKIKNEEMKNDPYDSREEL